MKVFGLRLLLGQKVQHHRINVKPHQAKYSTVDRINKSVSR